jgi:hypothetical protein
VQFTIESRELTNESTHRSAANSELKWATIEAADPDEAISRFVRQSDSQLVSFLKPSEGRESIATVKKDDAVFLVRVYEA